MGVCKREHKDVGKIGEKSPIYFCLEDFGKNGIIYKYLEEL